MLLVGKAVNYAAKGGVANTALTPADLDAGSIGVYGTQLGEYRDSLIVSGATAAGKISAADFKGKIVKLAEGLGGGKFKVSEFLDIKSLDDIQTSAYAAPVAWKAYIGYNGTSGAVQIGPLEPVRNEVLITVRRKHFNLQRDMPYFYNVLIDPTGETAATILAKLKAAIDDGQGNPVIFDTLISNGGLRLTAKDPVITYEISMVGAIETTPITIEGADQGSGTLRLLKPWEKESQAKRGNIDTLSTDSKMVPDSLVDTTYDIYILSGVNSHVPGGYGGAGLAGNPRVGTSVKVQLAFVSTEVSTAGKVQIEFETIIKALTGQTFTSLVAAP